MFDSNPHIDSSEADDHVANDSVPADLAPHDLSRRLIALFGQSYGMSVILHALLLAILGSIIWTTRQEPRVRPIDSWLLSDDEFVRETDPVEVVPMTKEEQTADTLSPIPDASAFSSFEAVSALPNALNNTNLPTIGSNLGVESHPANGPLAAGSAMQGALSVRTKAIGHYGGSFASEAAVELTLDWLARHQAEDGSWSFDHASVAECGCRHTGTNQYRTGSTGAALLTYFGAGHSFADGPRSETIRKGLEYLLTQINVSEEGHGDLKGGDTGHGGIYQHGMATAALAEALSITRALLRLVSRRDTPEFVTASGRPTSVDELLQLEDRLEQACEQTIDYVAYHQDPEGGGWAYEPQKPGDTSILGWQLMALFTARAEDIRIRRRVFDRASDFLDSVASGEGYAYRPGEKLKPSTTAIGAVSRVLIQPSYLRRKWRNEIAYLSNRGPSKNDMYYNYYATQALFAWGDEDDSAGKELWTQWNDRMRDMLVAMQATEGHEAGSWRLGGRDQGGRHFDTCLAAMTLEIYYRKLPAYQRLAAEPLDLK